MPELQMPLQRESFEVQAMCSLRSQTNRENIKYPLLSFLFYGCLKIPFYRCPVCGRVVKRPSNIYYCKKCGSSAIMEEVSLSEVVAGLSPLEREVWEYICTSGKVTADELRSVNPAYLGAVGKLVSLGLVERERLPWITYFYPVIDILGEEA